MRFLELTDSEIAKMKYLAGDKATLQVLEKFMLAQFLKDDADGVEVLAAQRLAILYLGRAFYELETLRIENREEGVIGNVV